MKASVKRKIVTITIAVILIFITWGCYFMPESFMYAKKGVCAEYTTLFTVWAWIGMVLSVCASVIVFYFFGEFVAEEYFDFHD